MRTPSLRHSFAFVAGLTLMAAAGCSDSLDPGIEIVLSQPSVDLRAIRGTTTPIAKTISVSNSGDGRLGPVSCPANPAPWLTCSVSAGNLVTLTATPTGLTAMNPGTIGNVGGSQAHENRQPFLTLTFGIALQGIFPSQN